MRAVLIGVAITLGLVAACRAPGLSLSPAPRAFTADDYETQYDAWTRSEDEYNFGTLRSVLHVSATFESWEFRWAYVTRYAQDHSLDTEARTAMLRSSLADAEQQHRFFVTLAGEQFRESDLTGRQSAWRVLLVDEQGIATEPLSLERVRRPDAAERTYFPSVNAWRTVYRVAFAARREDGSQTIPNGAHYVILRFTGALGRVDLRWNFLRQ